MAQISIHRSVQRSVRAPRTLRSPRTRTPLSALLDLLGRRWALRVLWELRPGPLTSRALCEACGGVSPTVIHDRTQELRDAGLVVLADGGGYALTSLGRDLVERFMPVATWSERWATARRRRAS